MSTRDDYSLIVQTDFIDGHAEGDQANVKPFVFYDREQSQRNIHPSISQVKNNRNMVKVNFLRESRCAKNSDSAAKEDRVMELMKEIPYNDFKRKSRSHKQKTESLETDMEDNVEKKVLLDMEGKSDVGETEKKKDQQEAKNVKNYPFSKDVDQCCKEGCVKSQDAQLIKTQYDQRNNWKKIFSVGGHVTGIRHPMSSMGSRTTGFRNPTSSVKNRTSSVGSQTSGFRSLRFSVQNQMSSIRTQKKEELTVKQITVAPHIQDNRESEGTEEDETPVKELMVFAVENEHTFDSLTLGNSTSYFTGSLLKEKCDDSMNDLDKDENESEKTDEEKNDIGNTESTRFYSLNVDSLSDEARNVDKNGKISHDCELEGLDTAFEVDDKELDTFEEEKSTLLIQADKVIEIKEDGGHDTDGIVTELQDFTKLFSLQTLKSRREFRDLNNQLLKVEMMKQVQQTYVDQTEIQLKGDNPHDSQTVKDLLLFASLDRCTSDLEMIFLPGELEPWTAVTVDIDLKLMVERLEMDVLVTTGQQSKARQDLSAMNRHRKKLDKKMDRIETVWNLATVNPWQPAAKALWESAMAPGIRKGPVRKGRAKRVTLLVEKKPLPLMDWSGLPPGGFKCKGDNKYDFQPTDSGDGSKGSGSGGYEGNRKSSREGKCGKGGNKENSRNNEDEKDIDEQENPPEVNRCASCSTAGDERSTGETIPPPNYRYRRRQNSADDDEQTELLYGKLTELGEDKPPDAGIMEEVGDCLVACLKSRKIGGRDVVEGCKKCAYLFSLISHFGNCPSEYRGCGMCQQTFCLVTKHVQLCMERAVGTTEGQTVCCLPVCQKIQSKFKDHPEKIAQRGKELWPKLKKYLARFSSSLETVGQEPLTEEDDSLWTFSLGSLALGSLSSVGSMPVNTASKRSSRVSFGFQPQLTSISENATAKQFMGSRSEPVAMRTETGQIVFAKDSLPRRLRPSRLPVSNDSKTAAPNLSYSAPVFQRTESGEVIYTQDPSTLPKRLRPERKVSFSTPEPTSAESLEPSTSRVHRLASPEEPLRSIPEAEPYTSLNPERVYVVEGTGSLPLNFYPPNVAGEQLLSVEMRPTGVPGIGEVVYGSKDRLQYVVRHWGKLKEEFQRKKIPEKQMREEGVILKEFKENFSIFRTRYQKNFQWIRLTHLGSGMSGKCHLAYDYNTDYKFCIKKIHILKFHERELDIWSELAHDNIVRLYGAIRRGRNIYIFEEFIDGGCLTETINLQKETRHRLSHWTALNYLNQILKVLVYLEKKSVIHEDIKADNILLRKDTTDVVVSDFGVAQRVEHVLRESSPVGTPTSYSPEKARGRGHGFKSDVWAALCVLIHMLSGFPPWVKRYGGARTIIYIIADKEPPFQDLPANISRDVRNLVEYAMIKDPKARPSAEEVLRHNAFSLLLESKTPETFVSILESPTDTSIETGGSDDVDKAVLREVTEQYEAQNGRRSGPQNTLLGSQGSSWSQGTLLGSHSSSVSNSTATLTQESSSNSSPSNTNMPQNLDTSPVPTWERQPELSSPGEIFTSVGYVTPRDPPLTYPETLETTLPTYDPYLSDLGVMPPPDPAKYTEVDPGEILRKYIDDRNVMFEDEMNAYRELLQPYEPDPDVEETENEFPDIEQILAIIDTGGTNIPDLNTLLGAASDQQGEDMQGGIPDVVHDMINEALEQKLREASTSSVTDDQNVPSPNDQMEENDLTSTSQVSFFDIDNLQHLLKQNSRDESMNTITNSNIPTLPTILDSCDDTLTTSLEKSHSGSASQQSRSLSSNEQRLQDFQTSDSSADDNISHENSPTPEDDPMENDVKDEAKNQPLYHNRPAVVDMPNWTDLMSMYGEENKNDSIKSDELFGSGDGDTFCPGELDVGQGQGHGTAEDVKGQGWDDVTPAGVPKPFPGVTAGQPVHQKFIPTRVIITDKSTGAITKMQMRLPHPVSQLQHQTITSRIQTESEDRTSVPPPLIVSPNPTSPKTSTPLSSPSVQKPRKDLHLQISPTRKTPTRQISDPQRDRSPKTREVQPYFTPQPQASSPPSWMTGNTPPRGSSSSTGRSEKKLEQMKEDHEKEIAELLEQVSRNSEHSRSLIDDFEEFADPEAEVISLANEDDAEYQSYLEEITDKYINKDTDTENCGALVHIINAEGSELFTIRLEREHICKTWEDVIEKELAEKISAMDISSFILVDREGIPLDLSELLSPGEQTIAIQAPADDSPWICTESGIQNARFY